jgi:chitodextrinase/peptidoglycan hydrolase-like protein with peptidoglycan-binding domain
MFLHKNFVVLFSIFYFLFSVTGVSAATATPCSASDPCGSITRSLSRGSSGKDVSTLQRILSMIEGVYPEKLNTGYFGAMTELAVQKFQAANDLASSGTPQTTGFGRVGPQTREKLLSYVFIPVIKTMEIATSTQSSVGQFGVTGRNQTGQSFKASTGLLSNISVGIGKSGDPTYPVLLSVKETWDGPSLASWTIPSSAITASPGEFIWITENFKFPRALTVGKEYFIVLSTPSESAENYYNFPLSGNVYADGSARSEDGAPMIWYDGFVKLTYTTAPPPNQIPVAPKGLRAIPISSTQINLAWEPSFDSIKVINYKIWRDGVLIATVPAATSYPNTGLVASTTYTYTIAAYNSAGKLGPRSATTTMTTLSDPDLAPPVVNPDYKPDNSLTIDLSATAVSPTQIDVSWIPSVNDVGVIDYKVWRNDMYLATVIGTSYSDKSVPPAAPQEYIVYAYDQAGYTGVKSNVATAKTEAIVSTSHEIPTVPTGLSVRAVSSSQISLSWAASNDNVGVVGYRVYRNGAQIATVPHGTQFSNIGLLPGSTYSYSVSAYDADGNESAQTSGITVSTFH